MSLPRALIELELEARPRLRLICDSAEDEDALRWWIRTDPQAAAIVDLVNGRTTTAGTV